MLENVKKNFESDPKKPAWNPAGNKLTICTGCGETVNIRKNLFNQLIVARIVLLVL